MQKVALIALMAAALVIGGCAASDNANSSGNSNETTVIERTVEVQPEPREGDYGSDAYLDGLYDECEAGDAVACEDLYMESPVGSEYEAYGLEQPWETSDNEPELSPSDQAGLDETQCTMEVATEGKSQEEIETLTDELVDELMEAPEGTSFVDLLNDRGYYC